MKTKDFVSINFNVVSCCSTMRSHLDWRGERNIFYKGVETSHYQTCFKTVRLTAIRNRLKRIISTSGELEPLQMILKPDTKRCASDDAGPLRGVDCEIHIGWREERNIFYKGVETSP